MEPTTSDDETQVMAATSVVTTKQQPIFYLVDATKSDEEANADAATSVATANQQANLDIIEAAKSDGEVKAITATPVPTTNEQANLDLRQAAKSDDEAKAVAALTQSGVDVNCRGNPRYRLTPLILAIQSNSLKVARVLLADPRVDVNATDYSGLTALHRSRRELLTAIILSQRTDIDWNVVEKTGRTLLLSLARINYLREIQDLSRIKSVDLFARSIDGFTALHEVAEQESPFPASFKKAPPEERCTLVDGLFEGLQARGHNLVSFVNVTDVLNRSALHYIAEEGSEKLLKRLLEKCPAGISVTGVDCHGFTPLHLAVRRGHTAVVELLLHVPCMDANVGATVTACNPSGLKPWESDDLKMSRPNLFLKAPKELPPAGNLTPLHLAAMDGHTEIVNLLPKWPGIHVAPLDTKGLSPFHYSIQNGHSGVLKLLLEKLENIAEPFTFCDEWLAPLEHSIQKGHLEVVKLLLEKGEPITPLNYDKQMKVDANASIELVAHPDLVASPLHFAALGGHVEAVKELLLHHNLDVNAKDNKNRTPLLCAIKEDKLEVVKALCFHDPGHRIRATEEYTDGRTPVQIATEANMKEIEKVLLERPEVKDFIDRLYRDRQVFVDAANALLVGAALIASVTFAGWLQPPLGYIPDYEFSQPFPAPPQTPQSYAAVKNHATVKAFWVFNSLSFFLAIATVLAGADAALPNLRDEFIGRRVKSVERALIRATILLVISVVCVHGAFSSAGFAVLPPLLKYDTSMIITVCLGGTICMLTLVKIIWKLSTPIRMRFLKTSTTMIAGGHASGLP
ncbi:hypothetical protein CY35_06G133500 [Sphagnum magellanicum]|nr:hypothetical protein CY35_06G133500 [Sphagnum magellanicum]